MTDSERSYVTDEDVDRIVKQVLAVGFRTPIMDETVRRLLNGMIEREVGKIKAERTSPAWDLVDKMLDAGEAHPNG